jgi:hypothetical protein
MAKVQKEGNPHNNAGGESALGPLDSRHIALQHKTQFIWQENSTQQAAGYVPEGNQFGVNFSNSMIFGGHTKNIHKGPDKDVGKDAQYFSNHNTVA